MKKKTKISDMMIIKERIGKMDLGLNWLMESVRKNEIWLS